MKNKTKQKQVLATKKIYEAREGAPFKQEDAQKIGVFIENCKDRSTEGILNEIKKHPKHTIHSLIEWNTRKASKLYQLSAVRNIVNHIEINIISLGDSEPQELNISVSAFKSVRPVNSEERVYVPIEEGLTNELYREQIIGRAKTELRNWVERYNEYKELAKIISALKPVMPLIKL